MTTAVLENKVRNTFTLEREVDKELKQFIKPRARSEFINTLVKDALKQERIKKLNQMINNIKPVKSLMPSEEMIRMMREGREEELDQKLAILRKQQNDQK
jgi:hypothetical protein